MKNVDFGKARFLENFLIDRSFKIRRKHWDQFSSWIEKKFWKKNVKRNLLFFLRGEIFLFEDERKRVETVEQIRATRQRIKNEIFELTERLRTTQENLQRVQQYSNDATQRKNENFMENWPFSLVRLDKFLNVSLFSRNKRVTSDSLKSKSFSIEERNWWRERLQSLFSSLSKCDIEIIIEPWTNEIKRVIFAKLRI